MKRALCLLIFLPLLLAGSCAADGQSAIDACWRNGGQCYVQPPSQYTRPAIDSKLPAPNAQSAALIADLKRQVAAERTMRAKSDRQVIDLQERIRQLETSLKSHSSSTTQWQADLEALRSNNQILTAQMQQERQARESAEAKNRDYAADLRRLEQANQTQIDKTNRVYAELEKLQEASGNVTGIQQENGLLKTALDEAKARALPAIFQAALPAVLTALGWATPPTAALSAISLGWMLLRRRRKKRQTNQHQEAQADQAEPFSVANWPRDPSEAAQFLRLSQAEGRDPVSDALIGRVCQDRLRSIIEGSTSSPEAKSWAKDLERDLLATFNEMMPPAVVGA